MIFNRLLCIVLLLQLLSCRNKPIESVSTFLLCDNNIKVNDSLNNFVDRLLLSEAIENIEIVQLEVNEEHLFKRLSNVVLSDSDIYINQFVGEIIRCNKQGLFKNGIGRKGQGPQEFSYVMGVQWSNSEQSLKVLTLLGYKYRIMSFSADGKYLNTEQFDIPYFGASPASFDIYNGFYILSRQLNLYDNNRDCSIISVLNPTTNSV